MHATSTKPKLLYVDDEEDNLLVFQSSMRRFYDVETANSAASAMDILKNNEFDVIVSDQRMPKVNGVEFLNNLPDEPQSIRIILTGYSDIDTVVQALNKGKIDKYISKPWQKLELQKTIDEALKGLFEKRIKSKSNEIEIISAAKTGTQTNADGKNAVLNKDEEIDSLKKQVDDAYKNVQLLGEIGQEIISNLTIDGIIESAYENVNSLMDANVLGIGILNTETRQIVFPGYLEDGQKLPFTFSIDDENRYAVWCYKNRKEIFVNDNEVEHVNYIAKRLTPIVGNKVESVIYLPLIIKDNIIGVMTAQSYKKNAYTSYHLNILRNIAIYVATALENAKSYSLIEQHKTEIEQKNLELEQKVRRRTEELQQKNEEVLKQNDELEATYRNVTLLSQIGQQITSTLSLEKIIETVYENVNDLMDASIFGIGVFNPYEKRLDFPGLIEKGVKLPFSFNLLDDENRLGVWCFINQKEVIINDYQKEYNKYIKNAAKVIAGGESESILYLPLMTSEGPIGVVTVQSFKKHIYSQYHIDILRSLASYITIAIQNSSSYRKMTQAFEQLKATQSKLVESEKMASLGLLTAGVAHEINNPVTFISGGIESLEDNYADIEQLLRMVISFNSSKDAIEQWQKIEDLKNDIEPERILNEMKGLFNSIKNGANRTAEIVKGLRNFSRLDENDMKRANLEEGLNNTLVILNNKLKNRITLKKEYGNIPEIDCYPGQLNQVFMNILNNSCDAIEEEGEITIITKQENEKVEIRIKDNGSGMPEEIRSHIFEPFFTTKPVGKGTGLGLSISYGIIEKHNGTIEVKSEVGKGTEFIITLPME